MKYIFLIFSFIVTILCIGVLLKINKTTYSVNNVAVMDMNFILNNSKAHKAYDLLVEQEHQKAKKIVLKYEEELRKLHDQGDPQKQFFKRKKEVEEFIENLKIQLSNFLKNREIQLQKNLDKAIQKVVSQKKIDILIHRNQIIYQKESCDITKNVLKEFEKLPN